MTEPTTDAVTVQCLPNGPYLVKNLKTITGTGGEAVAIDKDVVALCRCGQSKNKPFCDGTHAEVGFEG